MIATAFNLDPTRTSLQRRSFVAEMTKRFGAVQRVVWHLVVNDKVIVNAAKEERFWIHKDTGNETPVPSGESHVNRVPPPHGHDIEGAIAAGHIRGSRSSSRILGDYLGLQGTPEAFLKHKAIIASKITHTLKSGGWAGIDVGERNAKEISTGVHHTAFWKGLEDHPTTNAFDFATDPDKIDHFQKWLQRQINLHILETRTATGNPSLKRPWLAPRIISAYKIGLARAYTDVKRAGGSPPTAGLNLTPEMKRAMDQAYEAGKLQRHLEAGMAVSTRKVELIYTRAYHDLRGITQDMSTKLSRILATGMINGDSPHSMARKMVQQISGISLRRARLIATTELTNAHAEGTLDGLEMQGVKRVTAQVEFQTAGDDRVCPKCKHLEGKRFMIDQARGVIPVHPSCRCGWLPV